MRASEIERLKALRAKKDAGKELSEKEVSRLESLEELERKEIEKDGRTNIKPGGENTGGSGQESRTSESTKQRKRDQLTSDSKGTNSAVDVDNSNSRKQTGSTGQANRNDRSLDDSNGSDRGFNDCEEYGRDRGDQGGDSDGGRNDGEEGQQEEGIHQQSTVLTGKPANVKPKRKTAGKKAPINPVVNNDLDFIAAVLQSGFSTIANVTNRLHWEISEDEAKSVSVPLTKMFDSLDKAKKKQLEKYINPVMLASAVAGIVVPRLMFDMQMSKRGMRVNAEREINEFINNPSQDNNGGSKETGEQGTDSSYAPGNNPDVNAIIAGLNK